MTTQVPLVRHGATEAAAEVEKLFPSESAAGYLPAPPA